MGKKKSTTTSIITSISNNEEETTCEIDHQNSVERFVIDKQGKLISSEIDYKLSKKEQKHQAKNNEIAKSLADTQNLYAWWKQYKNTHGWFCSGSSYYTEQLEKSLKRLNRSIYHISEEENERALAALTNLYSQVKNWETQHKQLRLKSSRYAQINLLKQWINNKIEQHHGEPRDEQDENDLRLSLNLPKNPINLYKWWKNHSALGFFKTRSKATQCLDKAIKFYSNSVILDRASALQDILIAIDVWKQDRQGKSQRVEKVAAFEAAIKQQLETIQAEDNNPINSPRTRVKLYSLSGLCGYAYYLAQDWLFEINNILDAMIIEA